jgi:hypothetical protein
MASEAFVMDKFHREDKNEIIIQPEKLTICTKKKLNIGIVEKHI